MGADFWFWLLLGCILMGAEWKLGSFFVGWFGLSGVLVAGALWLFPAAHWDAQVFLWIVASLTLVWSRFGNRR